MKKRRNMAESHFAHVRLSYGTSSSSNQPKQKATSKQLNINGLTSTTKTLRRDGNSSAEKKFFLCGRNTLPLRSAWIFSADVFGTLFRGRIHHAPVLREEPGKQAERPAFPASGKGGDTAHARQKLIPRRKTHSSAGVATLSHLCRIFAPQKAKSMKILTDEELKASLSRPVFRLISEVADELGYECYVIGGYVRDLFLERPSKDIDCVVVGSGVKMAEAVAKRMREKLRRKVHIAVYANFGTAQIHFANEEIEFVGARRESYSHDSRKPVVEDGTLEDDQNRRDFTINAMALCLNGGRFGELVDPFFGVEDLEDGIIRTPLGPDITFSDDPLRMMRCVRFATQLNFYIEEETFNALCRNAERIKIVSGERVIDELNKIMLSGHPSKGLIDLERCGLLALIFPELCALQGIETMNGRGHKDNFYHTLEVLENVVEASEGKASLWLRWAALLHDIGKPRSKRWDAKLGWTFHNHDFIGQKMVPGIFRRLKLPLDERMKYVQKLVGLHMRPIVIADDEVTDSAVRRLLFDAGDDIGDLMQLCEADITSKNEQRKQRFLNNFRTVRRKLVEIEEKDRIRNMRMPVNGEEIMELFHLPPCREIGLLKEAMKNAILDGLIPNEHGPARQFILEEAEKLGLAPVAPGPSA